VFGRVPGTPRRAERTDEHGVHTCTSDGDGAWDCQCAGRATHVTHLCPLPEGVVHGSFARGGGLPQPRDPAEIPDEIDTRLYTCIDAVFSCGCE
jgi:hypothetical protein